MGCGGLGLSRCVVFAVVLAGICAPVILAVVVGVIAVG
jgi:hypothetical protein